MLLLGSQAQNIPNIISKYINQRLCNVHLPRTEHSKEKAITIDLETMKNANLRGPVSTIRALEQSGKASKGQ